MDTKPKNQLSNQYESTMNINDSHIEIGDKITNIYIINQRMNLKDMNDCEEHEFIFMCVGMYKRNALPGYHRITCVNIQSGYHYITDHTQIDIAVDMWDEQMDHAIIRSIGKVYEYTRGDKSVDYAIEVTKILYESTRLPETVKFNINKLTDEEIEKSDIVDVKYLVESYTAETYTEIILRQLESIDHILSCTDNVRSRFVSNSILTYYFANTQKEYLENQRSCIKGFHESVLCDISKLLSLIICGVTEGKITMWRDLFRCINTFCNYSQGIEYDITDPKISKEDRKRVRENIAIFLSAILSSEHNTVYDKIRLRNKDYKYSYPSDKALYSNHLDQCLLSYMNEMGYCKLK